MEGDLSLWNETIKSNTGRLDSVGSMLTFLPFYNSVRPWLVVAMSFAESILKANSLDLNNIGN